MAIPPSKIVFGTDGWRAIIAEDFTFANVRVCAQAVCDYLRDIGQASRGLVVGYDTRFASEHFASAVAEVAAGNGVPVYLCDGSEPTPVVSYSVLDKKAGGGVVITASHNPALYNGFKYKPEYAGSAAPEVVSELEKRIAEIQVSGTIRRTAISDAARTGTVQYFDAKPAYDAQIGRLVDLQAIRDAGLSIVADAMYGAGSGYFQRLLAGGRTRVVGIRQERNPAFPGINPEPITPNLAQLAQAVRDLGADVGLATDGDSDRIGVMDETGTFINQHQVYALLLLYLLEVRGQRGPAVRSVTTTVMADKLGQLYGIPVYETAVGFKYIGPKMMETDALMGGEESGGFGFRGHIPERDAVLAGLYLLDLVVKLGRPLSGVLRYLQEKVGTYYYSRVDVHYKPEEREAILKRVSEARPAQIAGSKVVGLNSIDGYKFLLEDGSWLLIRFSGTEPLLRIYTETTSQERVARILQEGRILAGV